MGLDCMVLACRAVLQHFGQVLDPSPIMSFCVLDSSPIMAACVLDSSPIMSACVLVCYSIHSCSSRKKLSYSRVCSLYNAYSALLHQRGHPIRSSGETRECHFLAL